jgi:branched-chain amino acid transport system ATP-binding protein
MSALLEVEGLEVVYGRSIRAVQGVSLAIEEGQIAGLVGLNGAGKSTTIRAISGFLPTENASVADGRIRFAGQSIRGKRPYQTAGLGISVVSERDKVFDTLTVKENLDLALACKSWRPASAVAKHEFSSVRSVLQLFSALAARLGQKSVFLSGGERQMLAIGCALLSEPRLLIVDEASLGLAPLIRQQVFDVLRRLNRDTGLTILVVDQDVGGILSISHHAYILENGRVAFAGDARSLMQHPDVREFYLGKSQESDRDYKSVKQYRRVRRWH